MHFNRTHTSTAMAAAAIAVLISSLPAASQETPATNSDKQQVCSVVDGVRACDTTQEPSAIAADRQRDCIIVRGATVCDIRWHLFFGPVERRATAFLDTKLSYGSQKECADAATLGITTSNLSDNQPKWACIPDKTR